MMRKWLQILPVFIYKRIAIRWGSRLWIGKIEFAEAHKDILIRVKVHE